jgi:hypothetical protein
MATIQGALRVLLVLAVIALAPLLLSRLNAQPTRPQPTAGPSASGTAEAIATPSPFFPPQIPGMAVSPLAARDLRAVELGVAQIDGDPKPTWIMAVTATRTQAIRDARPPGSVPNLGPVVYLVVMKGDFAYTGVDTRDPDAGSGHYEWAIFDPSTLTPLGASITNGPPAVPLSRFGPVVNLLAAP